MSSEFEQDLQACRSELDAAREQLLRVVTALRDDDFERARRGGWTVRRILEHVIYSEHGYSRVITHLRGHSPTGDMPECSPASSADALERLRASREALSAALEAVDEETFYTIGRLGHEEYSILSVLENEINHEREHAEQVRAIVSE